MQLRTSNKTMKTTLKNSTRVDTTRVLPERRKFRLPERPTEQEVYDFVIAQGGIPHTKKRLAELQKAGCLGMPEE
jgi:hypothetical protein